MIKNFTLSILAATLSFSGFAQTCTPDGSFSGEAPGIYPVTPLEPSCDLIAAKTIVSLTDTFVQNIPIVGNVTLYFDAMQVNSIDGLPAGLTFETDVMASATAGSPFGLWLNSGLIPNQTSALGCAFVYGSGGDWDALLNGGPNNDGVYPLTFHVDARIAGSVPDISIIIATGSWISTVDPGVGGGELLIDQELHVLPGYSTINAVVAGEVNPDPFMNENYSVASNPDVTYNWSVTNGTITGGQGTNAVTVEWDGSPTGNIQVELTDGGCYGISDLDVTVNPVGIANADLSNLRVWPNPSSGIFEISGLIAGSRLEITDLSGRVFHSEQVNIGTKTLLDLSDDQSGVYLLRVTNDKGTTTKRIIKN
ncbi:MAG: hypothetical protein ACI9P8_001377 [Bacteroidia bacterium]|jgi:hypothetical protein